MSQRNSRWTNSFQEENLHKTRMHWEYFMLLEKELEDITRFIAIHNSNMMCHSIVLAKFIISCCTEIESSACVLASAIQSNGKKKALLSSCSIPILDKYPHIQSFSCSLYGYTLLWTPWQNWPRNKIPQWFEIYNGIKHHRIKNFEQANFHIALTSFCALYTINLFIESHVQQSSVLIIHDSIKPKMIKPAHGYKTSISWNGEIVNSVDLELPTLMAS